ncbi:single-stranded DNA-binding protein [Mucilaginibacter sp.]|jgi:single-strand DNA-binding protein|uniref:single-stranded DNA-binding protein n=1 Tax=Mucilaginibacter sp. TaxID=1882438 RepID=UPI00356A545E
MLSNTGINKIILLGQIYQEPQMSADVNRNKFLYFTLVTNEVIKKGQDSVEHNEYHNIKIPEKLITQDALCLEFGQTLYIEGKIQTTSFMDDLHVKRYNLEIVVNKVEVVKPVPSIV